MTWDPTNPIAKQPEATTPVGQIAEMVGPYIPYERIIGPVVGVFGKTSYEALMGIENEVTQQIPSLTKAETKILNEAESILQSKEFKVIKEAYVKGTYAEVKIGERKIAFEPDLPSSGFTNHVENGFYLGKEAFTLSPEELSKTVLHELYRLGTQTGEMSVDLAKPGTDAAAEFADRAIKHMKK